MAPVELLAAKSERRALMEKGRGFVPCWKTEPASSVDLPSGGDKRQPGCLASPQLLAINNE